MKKAGLICLALISVLLLASCTNTKHEANFEDVQYEENVETISSIFKDLNTIDKVYFKSVPSGSTSILGPSTYNTAGFICISEEEMNELYDNFSFNDEEPTFPSGITLDVTNKDSFIWKSSDDFSKSVLKGNYVGKIYIDVRNNIIFFDIESA